MVEPKRRRAFLAVLALALLVPVVHATPGWLMFQADALNSGRAPTLSDYEVFKEVWWQVAAPSAGLIDAGAVVPDDKDMVIVADLNGRVRALNATTGAEVWNHTMANDVAATPAIASGRVLVVDIDGTLKALKLETGEVLSQIAVGKTFATPVVHEGVLFMGNEAGLMQAFKVTNTPIDRLWSFDTSKVTQVFTGQVGNTTNPPVCSTAATDTHPAQPIRAAPAVYRNTVIFGSMNHWVYALDERGTGGDTDNPLGQTTTVQWIFQTDNIVLAAPTVDVRNDRALVGSYDSKLRTFDVVPTNAGQNPCFGVINNPDYTFTVPGENQDGRIHASPAIDGDRAFVGSLNGKVLAIDVDDFTKKWEHTYANQVRSAPVVANGTLVTVHDTIGVIRWLRDLHATNATVAASHTIGADVEATPAIAHNRLYVSTQDGVTIAFGQERPAPPPPPAAPDLVVHSVTLKHDGITIVVANVGDADAEATTATLTINDTETVTLEVPALTAGEERTLTHAVNFTQDLHSVTVNLAAVAGELAADNNGGQASEYVVSPFPEDEAEPTDEDAPPTAGGAGLNWVLIALVVLIILVASAAVAYVVKKKQEPHHEEE